MYADHIQYAYGPVPSRRFGKSLGVNTIPAKFCTYSCIYCQVGRTSRMTIERGFFYDPAAIVAEVKQRIAKMRHASESIDFVTLVPDGEPTLDIYLSDEIVRLKEIGLPVAVITNSSLLWREGVRSALGAADCVSLKVDSVDEAVWRRVNRPHKDLRLPEILEGILGFSRTFAGRLLTETMLVRGVNDSDGSVEATADFIGRLNPHTAYLSVPTRPPAEPGVLGPDEKTLNRVYQLFAYKLNRVQYLIGYEGNTFAFSGDVEKDLLGITAVHPMREDAVGQLLARAGASWDLVDRLSARGDLVKTNFAGHWFYLRKLKGQT